MDGHTIVVDLGYGDCGKGTTVDRLCADHLARGLRPTVVRFNGGAQAAHTVVLADGRKHTFAQFGAGTLRPGVRTHLSRFTVVDPLALVVEAEHLQSLGVDDVWWRLTVDARALLATPYHRAANRARETARGADRHGSCGMGVGETMAYALANDDAPTVGDCRSPAVLRRRLDRVRRTLDPDGPDVDAVVTAFTAFAATVSIVDDDPLGAALAAGPVVFEGAQGVLLDEWHGFHPYTTWSTTTFANAETLLREAGGAEAFRLGVLRTFTTRHGAGPLVTEDPALGITDPHNPSNPWQGPFRVGHFDAVAHRYAIEVCEGVDGLALTHLDLAARRPDLRMCVAYADGPALTVGPPGDLARQERTTRALHRARPTFVEAPEDWRTAVSRALGAPVVLESWGQTAEDKVVHAPEVQPRCTSAAPQPDLSHA